jgi:hypothetical protein
MRTAHYLLVYVWVILQLQRFVLDWCQIHSHKRRRFRIHSQYHVALELGGIDAAVSRVPGNTHENPNASLAVGEAGGKRTRCKISR